MPCCLFWQGSCGLPPASHTVLHAYPLLQAAGLDTVLADPELSGTLFAPTDAAFAKLLKALGVSADELLAQKDLLVKVSSLSGFPCSCSLGFANGSTLCLITNIDPALPLHACSTCRFLKWQPSQWHLPIPLLQPAKCSEAQPPCALLLSPAGAELPLLPPGLHHRPDV